jgi:pilus assembly protein CpaB
MRLGSLLTTIVGLGVAGGSAYLASNHFETQRAATVQADNELVEVIVAGRDITMGQAIEPHLLSTISWPSQAVPAGVFTEFEFLLPQSGNQARRAKRAISQGELILASKVSDFGEKVTIVQSLGPNLRAMAIKVDAETAVGGFVTPGDFVDIVLTQGRNEALRAVTILQAIRVVGVDQDADEQTDTPGVARTVTVEVSPEQGQKLALAQKAGTLSLSLRTLDSTKEDEPLESIKLSDVLQEVSPVPEGEKSPTIVVRRGIEISEEEASR